MARRSAPRSSRCVAKECRIVCGLSAGGRLPRRACAEPAGGGDVGLRDQAVHLFERQELGQGGPRARRLEIVGRAALEAPVEHEKTVEAANGGNRSGDRARRQAAGHLSANERLERMTVERFWAPAGSGGERGQRGEIPRVALERVFGKT